MNNQSISKIMDTSARNRRKKMGYLEISHRKHAIYEGINTIGRDKEATVIIRDLTVSHQHAVIVVVEKDRHFIADMKSANGTEMEGNGLRSFELYQIEDGCHIKFASHTTATYTKINDENMSMSMMASQNTQVDDGFYAARTQIVEDSFAVPLPPPPKQNVELFPDDDASFSGINTQALIEQIPTQIVQSDVPDIHDVATQVLDIHDMNTQIMEHTSDIHDMATQVIEEKNVEDQAVNDAIVINEDTRCDATDQAITDAAVVEDQALLLQQGQAINLDRPEQILDDRAVAKPGENEGPAGDCENASKGESQQSSNRVPDVQPNDEGESSNDMDRQSQLQTSLLTRRLRNVLCSDDDRSPESFVDSDPQSQLPLTNMKRKVSNVIRSDSENEVEKEVQKGDWSGDSEDFATVNVEWDDAEIAQASRSPKKKKTTSSRDPGNADSSSENTDVEDNGPSKPENTARNLQQDLNGSTDCSSASDHKRLADNSDSDTDVEGNVEYNASFLETTTDSFIEKRRSLNVTNEIIPATQDPRQIDEDDDIIPSTQTNMSNSDSLCFSLRVECSEDESGTKNSNPPPSDSAAPSNGNDLQTADFDFAVPKAAEASAKKESVTSKQNVQDSFDFDCPTQKVTEENDFNFVAPTQELLSDSFDFAAPTQRIATTELDKSGDADFDAPTQKITGGSVDFEAATEKLFEPNIQKQSRNDGSTAQAKELGNDNFDFDVPTQKIDNHSVALKTSTDVDFDAPTQKVVVDTFDFEASTQKLPDTNYRSKGNADKNDTVNFVPPTQELVNDSFDFDAPTQKVNTTKANAEFRKSIGQLSDSFDFDAPTQKISTTKVNAEFNKSIGQSGDVDFEAATQKLVESYIVNEPNPAACNDFELATQKNVFDAPTQDISVDSKQQKEVDDFDFLAPTQQIVLPPSLEDTPETNVFKELCLKTVEAAKTAKKKVSFGHVENLEDNTKGVESQLEVIFATQAVLASPDRDRPANPIGEAFNNASTQEVFNCLAADSGSKKIAAKTRLSKLSMIKHDVDEEKDLTDVSDDECGTINVVKAPEKSEKSTIVGKPPEKVKSDDTEKSKSTKRSLRNTKHDSDEEKDLTDVSDDECGKVNEVKAPEKSGKSTAVGKPPEKVKSDDIEKSKLTKRSLRNTKHHSDEEKDLTDVSDDECRKVNEVKAPEKSGKSSAVGKPPENVKSDDTEKSKSTKRSLRNTKHDSDEEKDLTDVSDDECGKVNEVKAPEKSGKSTAVGKPPEKVKSDDTEKSKSTKRSLRNTKRNITPDQEVLTNEGNKRLRRSRRGSVEKEVAETSIPERQRRKREPKSDDLKKQRLPNIEEAELSDGDDGQSTNEEGSESRRPKSSESDRSSRLRTRRVRDETKSIDVQSLADTSNAIKRRHVDNSTVLNVTSKKTKSDDKIKITVPKKQINLEISDSEVAQQSFVADATFNKVAENRLKRERVQANSDSSKRKRTVDESQLSTSERKKRNLKPKIVFTMLDSPELCQIIRSLGGFVVDTVDACTVLVTKNVLRSQKLLCAVAQGKPICPPDWLYACKKANVFLDPWENLINDKEAEKKWNFSLALSYERSRQAKLFEGYSFQLIVNNAADVLKGAIESAGGKCVARAPKTGSKFLIIASQENKSKCSKFSKQGHKIALPEAVFDGVLRQELVFDKHLLIL